METRDELKELKKERKTIAKEIMKFQKREDDIIIKIRRIKKEIESIGTPWRKDKRMVIK